MDPFAAFDADPLAVNVSEVEVQSHHIVPNKFPTIPSTQYRLAIISDYPCEDDLFAKTPLSGMAGRVLDQLFSKHSIARASCFVGNIIQSPVPNDEVDPTSQDYHQGVEQLRKDLLEFKPNLCLLLGQLPFKLAHDGSIFDWRGSLFISDRGPFVGLKCLGTLHPDFCFKQYDGMPLLSLDLRRARKEAEFPNLNLPIRTLYPALSFNETLTRLDSILSNRLSVSCDIEGGVRDISCIGFAETPATGFVVPFSRLDGSSYWTPEEETLLWKKVAEILSNPLIKKTWQNGLYDRFVLQWARRIIVRNNADDTMLKHWELYCEMEKSLGFQASIYTNEPYYKFERKTENQDTFYLYCAKDAAITAEINDKLEAFLTQPQKDHYQFNLSVLNSLLYMELKGIKYDQEEANRRLQNILNHVNLEQAKLDSEAAKVGSLANPVVFTSSKDDILARIQSVCCYKKNPTQPKKDYEEDYYEAVKILMQKDQLSQEDQGLISALVGASMNTKSPMFKDFLYKYLKLPVQYKKDPKTKLMRPTSDYDALLKLSKDHNHPALLAALELSRFRTRAQMLAIRSYRGRMHCSYNLVGSETGRVTSSKSMLYVDGKNRVGANMQTIPDEWDMADPNHPLCQGMRDLLQADDGCYLGKADLKGADGWTIGAYMAMLGDRTMLDDLLFGIKPAQVVAYILVKGASAYHEIAHDRPALQAALKCITKDMWQYFVSKIGIWGTFYTMGPRSLAGNVFIQSEGAVRLSEKDAREFQQCILVRYRAKLWQDWMQSYMTKQPYPPMLAATNGFTRRFFARKTDVLGQALAHLPQVYTTWATLMAAYRLWTDPSNRRIVDGKTHLIVEPMHQVHDELLMQWKIEDTEFAKQKVREWFQNPMIIANQKIIIPYSGAYGTAWSMDKKHMIGEL